MLWFQFSDRMNAPWKLGVRKRNDTPAIRDLYAGFKKTYTRRSPPVFHRRSRKHEEILVFAYRTKQRTVKTRVVRAEHWGDIFPQKIKRRGNTKNIFNWKLKKKARIFFPREISFFEAVTESKNADVFSCSFLLSLETKGKRKKFRMQSWGQELLLSFDSTRECSDTISFGEKLAFWLAVLLHAEFDWKQIPYRERSMHNDVAPRQHLEVLTERVLAGFLLCEKMLKCCRH